MVYKIGWTPKALESYISNIRYLETKWTEREVKKFIKEVEKKIKALSGQPGIGSLRNKKQPNIRHSNSQKNISHLSL
jgi:plasmid stabilization system protein ParE